MEAAKTRVSSLVTQCLRDIEKMAVTSGLTMRDLGVDVEKYSSPGDSCIIELRMKL
ncbi:MAG TPA: hypothetical protein PLR71_05380 [Deltaproteobacteria bacterium]|nr:hypothetical protein [Deltaproteobacteria bacterium]